MLTKRDYIISGSQRAAFLHWSHRRRPQDVAKINLLAGLRFGYSSRMWSAHRAWRLRVLVYVLLGTLSLNTVLAPQACIKKSARPKLTDTRTCSATSESSCGDDACCANCNCCHDSAVTSARTSSELKSTDWMSVDPQLLLPSGMSLPIENPP